MLEPDASIDAVRTSPHPTRGIGTSDVLENPSNASNDTQTPFFLIDSMQKPTIKAKNQN